MIELARETFEKEVLNSKIPAAVLFYNNFSGPAIEIIPVFESISKKYSKKMKFARIDVEKHPSAAAKFIDVESDIPTIMFFKDGDEVDRIIGACSEYTLNAKIDDVLVMKK